MKIPGRPIRSKKIPAQVRARWAELQAAKKSVAKVRRLIAEKREGV